ncbi:MAG: NIPSNAP family protein [Lautropia sp.]
MLIDLRTYTFHPGKLSVFLPRFEAEGLPLQTRHCGNLVGYFLAETGTLNQVVQLWAYLDAADRDARRARLWADPEWQTFGAWALPLIQHQENRLLKPTTFSPRKWA